jgi:hypothetical protein
VGKIQAGDVHACEEQLFEDLQIIGGRTQSADDPGFTHNFVPPNNLRRTGFAAGAVFFPIVTPLLPDRNCRKDTV